MLTQFSRTELLLGKTIRQALISDLEAVTALEAACFPPAEAADKAVLFMRLQTFPQCFWLLERDGQLCAMIGGMTTDQPDLCDAMYEGTSLYAEHGNWLMLFGVATHPDVRYQGLASKLMRQVIEDTQKRGCTGIVLTCKGELLPFYTSFGFVNEGISGSVHGGAVWYQMRLDFLACLEHSVLQGEETHFYLQGRRVLLYGWEQCDGFVLNIADAEGEIIWQTLPASREQCVKQFDAYMKNQ